MKKAKKIISNSFLFAGVFCLILSAVMCFNNNIESSRAGKQAALVAAEFNDLEVSAVERGVPVKRIDKHDYIGIIVIPSVQMCLPVMSDIETGNLKTSPCRYTGNTAGRNLVIAGHNYKTHFGKLKQVKKGDAVYWIDAYNQKTEYCVSNIEILPGNAVESMNNSRYHLTLFTCTSSGKQRYTVRCLIKNEDESCKN